MAKITAVLPVEQAVACFASLRQAAESAKDGDERTKAQIKADTLVERVTGQATATAIPVEVQLVMTSDALLGRSDEPAQLPGHQPYRRSWPDGSSPATRTPPQPECRYGGC